MFCQTILTCEEDEVDDPLVTDKNDKNNAIDGEQNQSAIEGVLAETGTRDGGTIDGGDGRTIEGGGGGTIGGTDDGGRKELPVDGVMVVDGEELQQDYRVGIGAESGRADAGRAGDAEAEWCNSEMSLPRSTVLRGITETGKVGEERKHHGETGGGARGGRRIVRLHSVLESADELVRNMPTEREREGRGENERGKGHDKILYYIWICHMQRAIA